MLTGITIEQAKERAPKWLWRKIEHSINLLQKAEKIALTYDKEDGFFLAFSSGKDSQALYHIAELAGVKFKAHINWTSVDPPQVIRFKRKYYPEVIEKKPEWSIYDRAVQRGILPSMRIRWCCADFKETAGAGKVTLIGIRKEESVRRAKRHEVEVSNRTFSGNLDEFGEWQKEQIAKKEEKLIPKMRREGKKVNEDEFSLTKDNEVRCINGKDSILISPIFEWTEKDVWTFLNDVVKVPHCELYDQGYKRIGCILCPMSRPKQKAKEMKDFPHVKRNWIKAIKAIRRGGYSKKDLSGGTSQPMEQRTMSTGCSEIGNAITPPNQKELWRESSNNGTDGQWRSDEQQSSSSVREQIRQDNILRPIYPPHTGRRKLWKLGKLPNHSSIRTWEQQSQQGTMGGFSDSPSLNGIRGGGKTSRQKTRLQRKFLIGGQVLCLIPNGTRISIYN